MITLIESLFGIVLFVVIVSAVVAGTYILILHPIWYIVTKTMVVLGIWPEEYLEKKPRQKSK
jgi:hypothetical protein